MDQSTALRHFKCSFYGIINGDQFCLLGFNANFSHARLEHSGPKYLWNELITLSTKYRDLTSLSQLAFTVYFLDFCTIPVSCKERNYISVLLEVDIALAHIQGLSCAYEDWTNQTYLFTLIKLCWYVGRTQHTVLLFWLVENVGFPFSRGNAWFQCALLTYQIGRCVVRSPWIMSQNLAPWLYLNGLTAVNSHYFGKWPCSVCLCLVNKWCAMC